MPRFVHPDTDHTIETKIPREAAELRAQGYREEIFDPGTARVEDVVAHLEKHTGNQREIDRVMAAEKTGRSRSTVLGWAPAQPDSGGSTTLTTGSDGTPAA